MTFYTCTLHFGHDYQSAIDCIVDVITASDVTDSNPNLDVPAAPNVLDDIPDLPGDETDGSWRINNPGPNLHLFCKWLNKANNAARDFAGMILVSGKSYIGYEGGVQPHIHMITELEPGPGSMKLRKYNSKLKEMCNMIWTKAKVPFQPDLLKWKRTSKGTWAQVNLKAFIKNYFATKPEWHRGPTSYNGFSTVIGQDLFDQALEEATTATAAVNHNPEALKLLSGLTSQAQEYTTIVKYLTDKGICTTEQMKHDQMAQCLLLNKMATPSGAQYLEKLLTDVRGRISTQHKLSYYCMSHYPEDLYGTPDNFMTRCVTWNRIDPNQWCLLLYKWSSHHTGKKNCLVLQGPPSTGKTLMASAIAACSPSTGMVNKNNENFPFCACAHRTLIWQEEGRLTMSTIEEWKCISGGTKVAVDKKGSNQQITIERTPVIWTTNSDPFLVYTGNMVTGEHKAALTERYHVVEMTYRLTSDFWLTTGHYPSEQECKVAVGQCVKWGSVLSHSVQLLPDISNSLKQAPRFLQPQAPVEPEEEEEGPNDSPDLGASRLRLHGKRRTSGSLHLMSPILKRWSSSSHLLFGQSMETEPGTPRPLIDLDETEGPEQEEKLEESLPLEEEEKQAVAQEEDH
nr:MAG: NS1 [Istigobius ornatus parvovirus]